VDGRSKEALKELRARWPQADFVENQKAASQMIRHVFKRPRASISAKLRVFLKGTPFQLKVWEALLRIPEGSVVAYKTLAKMTGNPRASRAVGTAVGQNPIAYLIPCHRVIRETGVLGDYKWGPARKKAILGREEKGS
jgi:AraC family transcriptional regulator of adaptative response/methylated-DNA-[protein]-cysteine methyltransferase